MQTLTKHTGTTTDTRGCEFSYTCYTQKDRVFNQETWNFETQVSRIYVCNEFPSVEAKSLKELKAKMGNL